MNTRFGFEPLLSEALSPKCPWLSRLGVVAFSHRECIGCGRLLAIDPSATGWHAAPDALYLRRYKKNAIHPIDI